MRDPGSVAEYSIPARTTPAPPRHRSSPRNWTPRTVTSSRSSTAVSAALFCGGEQGCVRCLCYPSDRHAFSAAMPGSKGRSRLEAARGRDA